MDLFSKFISGLPPALRAHQDGVEARWRERRDSVMDEAKRLLNNEEIERTKHGRKDEASGDLSQNRTASPQPDRDATNCPWGQCSSRSIAPVYDSWFPCQLIPVSLVFDAAGMG